MKNQKQVDPETNLKIKKVELQIDELSNKMTVANLEETQGKLAALTVRLRILRKETDFTMSNRMNWGIRLMSGVSVE